jgi:hypothetical protein
MANEPKSDEKMRAESDRLHAETGQIQIEFLRTELESCYTLLSVANGEWHRGQRETAKLSIRDAEKGYATLVHFLSDPGYVARISGAAYEQIKAEVSRLRTNIDRLRERIL